MNEAWKELKQECAQCRRCGLGETRHHLVFGDGAEETCRGCRLSGRPASCSMICSK